MFKSVMFSMFKDVEKCGCSFSFFIEKWLKVFGCID